MAFLNARCILNLMVLYCTICEVFRTLLQLSPFTEKKKKTKQKKKTKYAKIPSLVRAVEKECPNRFELTRPIRRLAKWALVEGMKERFTFKEIVLSRCGEVNREKSVSNKSR